MRCGDDTLKVSVEREPLPPGRQRRLAAARACTDPLDGPRHRYRDRLRRGGACYRDRCRDLVTEAEPEPADSDRRVRAPEGHRRPVLPFDGRHLLRRRGEAAAGLSSRSSGAETTRCRSKSSGCTSARRLPSCRRAGGTATCWTTLRNCEAILTVSGGWPSELDYAPASRRGDPRALGRSGVRRGRRGDGARARTRVEPRSRRGGPRRASDGQERWLSSADTLDTFLLSRQARRLRRVREHRTAPARAARAVRLRALRLRPVADRRLPESERVEPTGLEQLLETSRVIFVLATPTSENRALLSRELLELVQADAVLVLVSRAHVVDFDALTELVLGGRFRAAIDVFPEEPLDPGASDPDGAGRRAVAASSRAGAGGALGDREPSRRRSRGARRTDCRRGGCRSPSRSSRPGTCARRSGAASMADLSICY